MRTTILFENFIEDKQRVDIFLSAVTELKRVGAEGVLLEAGTHKTLGVPSENPIEEAAIRASWRDGYYECLRDIFNFRERYLSQQEQIEKRADFAAYDELYNNNEISEEEYEHLTGRKPIKSTS